MPRNIPLFKVYLPENIDFILRPILESGYISEGEQSAEFEQKLGIWLGNSRVAPVNNGTMAITIALRLAGIESGTEVIASPQTCTAGIQPILSLGGKIVWCDINPATGNIDHTKIRSLITNKTKAITFVDWAGTPAQLDEIMTIAREYNLKVIEDAAHSFGAKFKGRNIGQVCDYTCFSFQAIKHLTTIDGGAIACISERDYEKSRLLRWYGHPRGAHESPIKWGCDIEEWGYKGHMNNPTAAIGIEQLKTIDKRITLFKRNGNYLHKLLQNIPHIQTLEVPEYIESSYWMYSFKCMDSSHRERVHNQLIEAGIGNGIVHTRNDTYTVFKDYKRDLPGMEDFGARMLNVPCGWWCTIDDMNYIAEVLESAK